jgi:hydrogenase maturation protease
VSDRPTGRTVVIGVGHRDRADDGIGPAVVDALAHRTDQVVTLVREGDLAVLPLLWEVDDDVVIVDAIADRGMVGNLSEIDPSQLRSAAAVSTHGLDVVDAIELARRLHCMPARLRVFGITARDFGYGPMSRELHHLVDRLADELLSELGCQSDVEPGDGDHPVS